MAKLRYWLGTGFCMLAEILFLLSCGFFALGHWFRTNTKKDETAK